MDGPVLEALVEPFVGAERDPGRQDSLAIHLEYHLFCSLCKSSRLSISSLFSLFSSIKKIGCGFWREFMDGHVTGSNFPFFSSLGTGINLEEHCEPVTWSTSLAFNIQPIAWEGSIIKISERKDKDNKKT